MNSRIRQIRKHYNISQTEFGRRIGVTLGVIKNLEQGKTQLTSPLFELLCKAYHVNPEWLHTGEGEMLIPDEMRKLSVLKQEYGLSDIDADIIMRYLNLPDNEKAIFMNVLKKMVDSNN